MNDNFPILISQPAVHINYHEVMFIEKVNFNYPLHSYLEGQSLIYSYFNFFQEDEDTLYRI